MIYHQTALVDDGQANGDGFSGRLHLLQLHSVLDDEFGKAGVAHLLSKFHHGFGDFVERGGEFTCVNIGDGVVFIGGEFIECGREGVILTERGHLTLERFDEQFFLEAE